MKNISVIIPSYKPNKIFIRKCVESFVEQFSNIFDHVEVIIIVNGCDRGYFEDVDSIFAERSNVVVLYEYNGGVSNARNIGLDYAKGDFIMFIDDDDWLECKIPLSTNMINDLQNDELLVFSSQCFNEENNSYSDDYLSLSYKRLYQCDFDLIKFRSFFSVVWGKIIPREVVGNIRFNLDLFISEDALFMFELSSRVKNIKLTSDIKHTRLVRNTSLSNRKRSLWQDFKITLKFIKALTKTYLLKFNSFSFLFYLTRFMGAVKYFFIKL
ncbi:glycosyltransferase family 2 protein [Myroides odoratimimus]|uniref:glycosyltransferase family 2 protein n=1 Tax=Myroides odoratimimus TaxID=76832 RepID=UPI002576A073|nr:glycosyltransferase [Myroides odoratimimus]MDM1060599.1 glycosyltransferase [Myroides odoratimimus]